MSFNSSDLLNQNRLFGIQYVRYDSRTSMSSNHYHDHYEIYYQLTGERYYFIKDRTYYVKKGDIVIININDLHKTGFAGASVYERFLINFKEDYLKDILKSNIDINPLQIFSKDINVYSLNFSDQSFVEQLLSKMVDEDKNCAEGYQFYIKLYLLELLVFLSRLSIKVQHRYLEFPSALHKKISGIAKYINENYSSKLTLHDLSDTFHVSPFYLSRTFKEVTGFTFTEYLNTTRIKEAQRLLVEGGLNITQISEKVGFDSPTHFGRVFKGITQLSPLKYRKINISEK
jgi:AraC-like DNA-binding protein